MSSPTRTRRWRGVVALSLFAGSVGVLAQRPEVLLLATVGVGYAAYARVGPAAPEATLDVERTTSPNRPSEGDQVAVTVVVRNEGDRWLPDLRLVDGVPSLLPVVEGSPRRSTALGPGEETTIEYAVEARKGKHRFAPLTALSRDVAGSTERQATVREATVVDCGASVPSVALRSQTRRRAGALRTDEGGSGVEFHRTRTYRRGDPMGRVDWRRFAKGGELSTVEFREERAAAVVLCVDAGRTGTVDVGGGGATRRAVARGVAAADRVARALADANHEVGLASLGPQFYWLPARAGTDHLARIQRTLDAHEAFAPAVDGVAIGDGSVSDTAVDGPAGDEFGGGAVDHRGGPDGRFDSRTGSTPALSDGGRPGDGERDGHGNRDGRGEQDGRDVRATRIRERLGPDAQVMAFTPLADDGVVDALRSFEAAGNRVTVVSPDETNAETLGGRLAATERRARIGALRRAGVPVVDWGPDEPLGNALAATLERRG